MSKRTICVGNEVAHECIKYPNYFITKTGELYSIFIKGAHGKTDINKPYKISYGQDKNGYYRVVLSNNTKKKYIKIHTIVVEQFIGEVPNDMVVNHIDGDKHNNCVQNLEIVTSKENTIHAHTNHLTSVEIQVDVEYNNDIYHFNSMKDCINYFPDISLHYLQQLKMRKVLFSMILFVKSDNTRYSKIVSYYNGEQYKIFNSMQDAAIFFKKSRGTVSSSIKSNHEYRQKISKYHITFPNVSTIESTDIISGSE